MRRCVGRRCQLVIDFIQVEGDPREQYQADEQHMQGRLATIDGELETEPAQIRSLALRRRELAGS